jgi:hypothetical protein
MDAGHTGIATKTGMNRKSSALIFVVIFFVCIGAVLSYHSVDNTLSEEDKQYIPMYLKTVPPLPAVATYADQLAFIASVQRSVLDVAPTNGRLPFGQKREPKELYVARTGLCFDRSRVIEKILRYSGFETRHIAIYSISRTGSKAKSLIIPQVPSHAVTEVLTNEGWLVVDSNAPWVSVDFSKRPVSIREMQLSARDSITINWSMKPPWGIYSEPFTFIYGLYSRHGKFYPPYNFIPDINYGELAQNLF